MKKILDNINFFRKDNQIIVIVNFLILLKSPIINKIFALNLMYLE